MKINFGMKRGIQGAVGRLNYHLQYSHGNGFNPGAAEFDAVALSWLMRDPETDIERLWQEWAGRKYGAQAAPT
jgi:hypothetical protein